MKKIEGLAGAAGQALYRALVLKREAVELVEGTVADPEEEIARFEEIRGKYAEELDQLAQKSADGHGQEAAAIMKAYAVIARDDFFFKKPIKRVRADGISMAYAVEEACQKVCRKFEGMDDPYMKERAVDIRNVCTELIRRLQGVSSTLEIQGDDPVILVAEDLTPEDTIRVDKKKLGGFITQRGGVTSHAVILAKTLGIPAVVGCGEVMTAVESGQKLYLNGSEGWAIVEPDAETEARFRDAHKKQLQLDGLYRHAASQPSVTKDGHQIMVCVNSGDKDSVNGLDATKCDGVGLFRTEFLFMDQTDYPSEQLQYEAYRQVAEAAQGKEVIIRTLDIGGDKQLDYMSLPQEFNPFLGYRAIRLCLDRKEMFLTQLRAILRASAHGKLKIMFPMIVTVEELRQAKALVQQAAQELDQEGVAHAPHVPVGIMIETPAAVLLSDQLAKEAEFFSIGTNDLIQYTTATDRQNERVQYLYTPCNLSVLRAIATVIENGHREGIPVGMCGEAASDPRLGLLLLGLGLDEFSVVPAQVGKVKYMVQHADYGQLAAKVKKLWEFATIEELEAWLASWQEEAGEQL